MAATFEFSESNGAGEVVTNGILNINFGNLDSPNLSSPDNRIVAGANGFEKWNRGRFSGVYTTIDNLKFFKSGGTLPSGVAVKAAVNSAYATPTDSTSVVATVDVPVVEGSALVPNDPGASPDFSGYIIMQMQVNVSPTVGAVPTQTFTLKYDEV